MSVVISHAAATSFIHMQTFAVSHVIHSRRNTGSRSGVHGGGVASRADDSDADGEFTARALY
ncbi:MAG: hypothetical protein OHK0044_23120 [Burkholderiaceae bacterium]